MDIQTLQTQIIDEQARKSDELVGLKNVVFDEKKRINFDTGYGRIQVLPEERAWKQLLRRFGDIRNANFDPKFLLNEGIVPDEQFRAVMAHNTGELKGNGGQLARWMFRLYSPPGEETVARAVMTERYGGDLNNLWLLNTALEAQANSKWSSQGINAKTTFVDRDSMRVDFEIAMRKDVQIGGRGDGMWSIGVAILNNETGSGQIAVLPWAKRGACDNTKLIDHDLGFEGKHLRGTMIRTKAAVIESLAHAFEASNDWLDRAAEAAIAEIPDFGNVLDKLCEKNGWGNNILFTMAAGSERQENVFGLSNALSAAGTHSEKLSWTDRVRLQSWAGAVLTDPIKANRLIKTGSLTTSVIAEEE